MQNPYKTKYNNLYELRNILQYINDHQCSPRSRNPLTKEDIKPDMFTQKEIMENISNVENSKDTLKQILKMKQDNKSSMDIDTNFDFIVGSTDKIIKIVSNKIYEKMDKEFSTVDNILKRLVE